MTTENTPAAERLTDTPATHVQLDSERADLLGMLSRQRNFLRHTTRDLDDEQARARTTVSELCLGGLIKHVSAVEEGWCKFILEGPSAIGDFEDWTPEVWAERAAGFQLLAEETLAGVLDAYADVARRTDALIAGLPDLNASQPLPKAPWYEPGARWTVRNVLLHLIAETAQHSGHADIIRESLDGAKTMG